MSDTATIWPDDCCWAASGWEDAGEGSVRDARKVGRDKARADFARYACEPWVEARVCLAGLDLRAGTTAGADRSDTGRQLERWVVHRALPRPLAGYVTIGAGFELRQGARCALH